MPPKVEMVKFGVVDYVCCVCGWCVYSCARCVVCGVWCGVVVAAIVVRTEDGASEYLKPD